MKTALLLLCAALCRAQDGKPVEVKRLASVNWDLATHKLVWTVEKGTVVDDQFVATSKIKYEVSPEEAFMAFGGEKRALGEDEAASLHQLLNVLTLYCVESVVWWDHGTAESPADAAPGLVTKPEPRPSSKSPARPDERKAEPSIVHMNPL